MNVRLARLVVATLAVALLPACDVLTGGGGGGGGRVWALDFRRSLPIFSGVPI
jgi:hypothetical protein